MNQPSFFDRRPKPSTPTAPYVPKSATSQAAARKVAPHAGTIRANVLAFLIDQGPAGATDEEIERGLRIHHDTARARRVELRDAGRVADSGKTRPTSSGREATVWIAARQIAVGRIGNPSYTPSPSHAVTPSLSTMGRPGPVKLPPLEARAAGGNAAGGRRDQGADQCRRCRSTEHVDVPIHNGQSTRRDCKGCGRFIRFTVWNGSPA